MTARNIPLLAWLLALPFISSGAGAATPDFNKVDAQIRQWMDAGQYPGAGIWIVDGNGTTLHEKYWGGYTRDTRVMMASSSKWIEAATLMTLVDNGTFNLDKPISTWLPAFKGSPQGANTLRQMLSHTSSLNHITIDERVGVHRFPELLARGHTEVKPGEVFQYGGMALATAFRAVEVATDDPWMTYFAKKIAKPCRMNQTFTGADPWTYDRIVGGDSFPFSCAGDYMNFLQMLLHDGVFEGQRVLTASAVREMQADQVRGAKVNGPEYPEVTLGRKHHGIYGLGEWRLVENEKGEAVVLSSPSFAGMIPWIDKRHNIAAVFVGRSVLKDHFDAFHSSAVLIKQVDEALAAAGK